MVASGAAAALLTGLLLSPSTPAMSHRAALPTVRVIPATFTEPTLGHRLSFTEVRLSAPSGRRVVVEISTRSGTAKAGRDFVPLHPTVVFAPGQTTAFVSVELLADDRNEPTETLRLKITEVRHAVAVRGGRIRILDAPGG
ncbi:MAG TPA: Calx-beta domain-containing protein [Actinomycetes bacterium]